MTKGFASLFGFDSWWDAQKYFDAVKFYQVNVLGEKPEVKLNSILSPFMQYLATLWLLRPGARTCTSLRRSSASRSSA